MDKTTELNKTNFTPFVPTGPNHFEKTPTEIIKGIIQKIMGKVA